MLKPPLCDLWRILNGRTISKNVKKIISNKPVRVYNFEVASVHNFFVQGVLVHNYKDN